jgi:chloride channel 2
MFSIKSLDSNWDKPHNIFTLFLFFLYKLIFTALSVSLPLPVGVTTPIFATGALLGRWYGEILQKFFPKVVPGAYAVIGAAGFSAGATRTVSTALLVFELTGQLHYMLPVLLVTLISYAVSASFSPSVYDLVMQIRGFPYVPTLEGDSYKKTAANVMQKKPLTLTLESTYRDAERILQSCDYYQIPIVYSRTNFVVVGTIPRSKLSKFVVAKFSGMPSSVAKVQGPAPTLVPPLAPSSEPEPGNLPKSLLSGPEEFEWDMTEVDADEMKQATAGQSKGLDIEIEEFSAAGKEEVEGPASEHSHERVRSKTIHARNTVDHSDFDISEDMPGNDLKNHKMDLSEIIAFVDDCPIQIPAHTPLPRVHFLFTMLSLSQILVTREGHLIGLITLADLCTTFVAKGTLEYNVDY